MSREQVANRKLDEVEKYVVDKIKNVNLDEVRYAFNGLGASTGTYISTPKNIWGLYLITSAGNIMIDVSKGENVAKQAVGLLGDGVVIVASIFAGPYGWAISGLNYVLSFKEQDLGGFFKKLYDNIPDYIITPNNYLRVTMPNGEVYARPIQDTVLKKFFPKPQGSIFGGNKNDVLFGGNGKDTLMGLGGNDILIGNGDSDDYVVMNKATIEDTWGNDTYTIMNRARATITDRDGKGTLIVDNEIMRGGTAIEGKKGVYRANGQHFEIYTYDESSKTLTINTGSEFVTIKNFNKDKNDLGIVLLDQGEISITISDNEKAEGNNGEQSMNFDIKVNGEIPKGEYAIININGQEYLIGNPSTENIKKDKL